MFTISFGGNGDKPTCILGKSVGNSHSNLHVCMTTSTIQTNRWKWFKVL